jgi:hypothetical protein
VTGIRFDQGKALSDGLETLRQTFVRAKPREIFFGFLGVKKAKTHFLRTDRRPVFRAADSSEDVLPAADWRSPRLTLDSAEGFS